MRITLVLIVTVALSASLSSQGGQEQPYPRLPAPPVKSPPDTIAPDIPGVVRGGTPVHLIRDLFHSTEGPIAMPDGTLRNFRKFATLKGGNADSMSVDNDGRLYVGTGMAGVQVFSAKGDHLGTIPTPLGAQATAFAGPDKKTLYIVGGGAVWKVAMIAQGIQG